MHLFVDKLTNVDFSFLDPKRGLVGETWLANVVLIGELDEQGMVCDFGIVKKMLRTWLDEQIDHRLLIPSEAAELTLNSSGNSCDFHWKFKHQQLNSSCPKDAVTLIPSKTITAESVAQWCIDQLMPQFPRSVKKLELTFSHEIIDGPYYHYSHGLKKHDGNCQRIAHGHRSPILIWRNGELSLNDMRAWAHRWKDIYIGTQEDCVPSKIMGNQGFRYRAQQGDFYLELPQHCCYLIDSDSTVEFIAQHIADTLKQQYPNDSFKVKAFEGYNKGAIAES